MPRPRSARGGVRALLALAVSICAGLGAAAFSLSHTAPADPVEAPSLAERVEAIDVVGAADRLSAQLTDLRGRLSPALMAGDEETLVQLLRMQAEACDMQLGTVRFEPSPRDGFVQPVGLEMELQGAYYDLPIFVDGLFRQRHALEIHRLTIEADEPTGALVGARLEARMYRPVEVPRDRLRESIGTLDLGASERGFAASALASAAQLEAWERFLEQQPAMLERSKANRRLVLRTIPLLVRKLPASPMDWVAATFEGETAQLAME